MGSNILIYAGLPSYVHLVEYLLICCWLNCSIIAISDVSTSSVNINLSISNVGQSVGVCCGDIICVSLGAVPYSSGVDSLSVSASAILMVVD